MKAWKVNLAKMKGTIMLVVKLTDSSDYTETRFHVVQEGAFSLPFDLYLGTQWLRATKGFLKYTSGDLSLKQESQLAQKLESASIYPSFIELTYRYLILPFLPSRQQIRAHVEDPLESGPLISILLTNSQIYLLSLRFGPWIL
jgi:hypothetical protein